MKVVKRFIFWAGVIVCAASASGAGLRNILGAVGDGGRGKSPQAAEQGKEVFAANCARCHGTDGRSQTAFGRIVSAPDLTDGRLQSELSDSRLRKLITRGRGQMPAFGAKLSRSEVADVIAYVRTLKE